MLRPKEPKKGLFQRPKLLKYSSVHSGTFSSSNSLGCCLVLYPLWSGCTAKATCCGLCPVPIYPTTGPCPLQLSSCSPPTCLPFSPPPASTFLPPLLAFLPPKMFQLLLCSLLLPGAQFLKTYCSNKWCQHSLLAIHK